MTDRDLIAAKIAIAQTTSGTDDFLKQADAILAAIGDRLLPELPDWVTDGMFGRTADGFAVRLVGKEDPYTSVGEGVSIPDAIRNGDCWDGDE